MSKKKKQLSEFGKRLQNLGIRQVDLARFLSQYSSTPVAPTTIYRWVYGEQEPQSGVLWALEYLERYPAVLEDFRMRLEALESGRPLQGKSFGDRLEALGISQFSFAKMVANHPRSDQSFDAAVINVDKWTKGKHEIDSWVEQMLESLERHSEFLNKHSHIKEIILYQPELLNFLDHDDAKRIIENEFAEQDSLQEPEEEKKLA